MFRDCRDAARDWYSRLLAPFAGSLPTSDLPANHANSREFLAVGLHVLRDGGRFSIPLCVWKFDYTSTIASSIPIVDSSTTNHVDKVLRVAALVL